MQLCRRLHKSSYARINPFAFFVYFAVRYPQTFANPSVSDSQNL